jgi:hypothetical protein
VLLERVHQHLLILWILTRKVHQLAPRGLQDNTRHTSLLHGGLPLASGANLASACGCKAT